MLVEEFLGEDKLEHGTVFLTTRKTASKKAASKPRGSFLLLSVQVLESNMNKDCFSQAMTKALSFHTGLGETE